MGAATMGATTGSFSERMAQSVAPYGLIFMGALHDTADGAGTTIALFGAGPGFWPIFRASPEASDGAPDPIDRWSTRVFTRLRHDTGALRCAFPFGGPPYEPFLRWALDSGEAWQSPTGMLVHREAGLMVSFRGALVFDGLYPLEPPFQQPCTACAAPCASTCPVDALSAERGYDVAACHSHLDTEAGKDCLTRGCRARRACPISARFGRDPVQSAYHMAAFHPS